MLYKNVEIHNVEQIFSNDDGSVSWKRVPNNVYENLEADRAQWLTGDATGVEIRFKMNCDKVTLKMAVKEDHGCFHVYRGGIQGSWDDHEVHKTVTVTPEEFVIERSPKPEWLKAMSEQQKSAWNSDVVRIIFDRGVFKLYDVIGDVEPPKKEDCPPKTIMCYGSSITHGSNSIDTSHAWTSVLAHNLKYDLLNKGMSGSCCMEPHFAEYIATAGQMNTWDLLILELGINVLGWEEEKIYDRVTGIIKKTASANPEKTIFVISPFYHCAETLDSNDRTHIWRRIIKEVIEKYNFPNVVYINGLELLSETENISADFVHPNIHGVAQIAERLTKIVKEHISYSNK